LSILPRDRDATISTVVVIVMVVLMELFWDWLFTERPSIGDIAFVIGVVALYNTYEGRT
jgi:hypothetical protein